MHFTCADTYTIMNASSVHVHVCGYIIRTYTVEPLYCGHHWDCSKCPDYRGVLISEVGLYRNVVVGTLESVLIIEVSLFQSVLISECPD